MPLSIEQRDLLAVVDRRGPVDYRQATSAAGNLEPARSKACEEDVAYINEGGA